MARESFAVYKVSVARLRAPREELRLDAFDAAEGAPGGTDAFDVLAQVFKSLEAGPPEVFEDKELTLDLLWWRVRTENGAPTRTIEGMVDQGQWGERRRIQSIDDDSRTFEQLRRDAGHMRFYFRLTLPAGHSTGLLLTQKSGQHGIKTMFWEALVNQRFRGLAGDDEFKLNFAHWYPDTVWEMWQQGEGQIKGVTLIRHSLPKRLGRYVEVPAEQRDEGRLEIAIKPRARGHLPFVKEIGALLEGQAGGKGGLAVHLSDLDERGGGPGDDDTITMDELKLDLVIDGRRMTVVIENEAAKPPRFSYEIDVTDGEEGWPDPEGLAAEAVRVESTVKGPLGW